jgi:hypothetical protein
VVPLRIAICAIGILIIFWEGSRTKEGKLTSGFAAALLSIYSVGVFLVSENAAFALGDPYIALNAQRFLVLPVIFLTCGWLIFKSGSQVFYSKWLVRSGLFASLIALTEFTLGRWILFPDATFNLYQRGDGTFRSLVAGEHPLVLGTILAALIALVQASKTKAPLGVSLILTAGVVATGSRGPALLCILAIVVFQFPAIIEVFNKSKTIFRVLAYSTVSIIFYLVFFVLEPIALGQTGYDYSSNYRTAIYALIPDIIAAKPLGYGFSEIPRNVWLIDSELYGARDLALTVDSELVLLVLNFGFLGLVGYLLLFRFALKSVVVNRAFGLFLLILTLEGFVLALHAWDSIGPLFFIAIGLAIGSKAQSEVSHISAATR